MQGTKPSQMILRAEYSEGCSLFKESSYEAAEIVFRRCLKKSPKDPDLINALGTVLDARGELDAAETCFIEACRLCQTSAPFHFNLANLLRRKGDRNGAEQHYVEAIHHDPDLAEAYHGLGSLYLEDGMLEPAEGCLLKAVSLKDPFPPALHDLGQLRQQQGRTAEAEQLLRRCVAADDNFLPALNTLGMVLLKNNRISEARDCFEKAINADTAYLQPRCNLAVLETWCGNLDFAIRELKQAIAVAPHDGDIHYNLALALLAAGRLGEGWQENEWRFSKARPVPMRHTDIPRWQGEALTGKSILIHAEQGYGDSLQFIRYASLLAANGATVLLEGQDRIITPLLAKASGVTAAFCRDEPMPFRPDYQVPMMSLPLALGAQSWPPPLPPYLHATQENRGVWSHHLSGLAGIKVGIAWAGRAEHENDANRSISPELLDPLSAIHGVSWVSLQFGPQRQLSPNLRMFDPSDRVHDFCDSAAIVAGLDLVITIDSAVAHLAGGLGVPTWLLLPWNPDWRWMHDRTDSPWYPSMRIYRQTVPGKWANVIQSVVSELSSTPIRAFT